MFAPYGEARISSDYALASGIYAVEGRLPRARNGRGGLKLNKCKAFANKIKNRADPERSASF